MANFQLLNNVDHQDLKVIIERSAAFGDNVWYSVTFPAEFRNLQRHYPIFFVKHPDSEEFQAVAMFRARTCSSTRTGGTPATSRSTSCGSRS